MIKITTLFAQRIGCAGQVCKMIAYKRKMDGMRIEMKRIQCQTTKQHHQQAKVSARTKEKLQRTKPAMGCGKRTNESQFETERKKRKENIHTHTKR